MYKSVLVNFFNFILYALNYITFGGDEESLFYCFFLFSFVFLSPQTPYFSTFLVLIYFLSLIHFISNFVLACTERVHILYCI